MRVLVPYAEMSRSAGRIGSGPGVLEALERGLTIQIDSTDWRADMQPTEASAQLGAPRRNTLETFWRQVTPGGFCWYWTGAVTHEGYGYMWLDGTTRPVHRLAYETLVGGIPEGLQIDHLCRTRNWVNPDHMEPVTATVNSLRANKYKMERGHCINGHARTASNTLRSQGSYYRCRQCILVRGHAAKGIDCRYHAFCADPVHSRGKYQRAESCRRGHSMADAYVRPDTGTRMCSECIRIRTRKSTIPCPNEPKGNA